MYNEIMTDNIDHSRSVSSQKFKHDNLASTSKDGQRLQSFPSMSSSESGFDGRDTVDAVPQRMPLICEGEDYIKRRQASVEYLIPSRRPYDSMPRLKRTYDGKYYVPTSQNQHPKASLSSGDHETGAGFICYSGNNTKAIPTCTHNLNGGSKQHAGQENVIENSQQATELSIVETDLGPSRQARPSLKDAQIVSSAEKVSTDVQNENQCCCSIGCRTCCAMFKWKYMFSRFSAWDCCLSLFSFCVYVFDVVSDLILVLWYYYYRDQDPAYLLFFRLTLAFVLGPSLIVQIFSGKWVYDDYRCKKARQKSVAEGEEKTSEITVKEIFMLSFFALLHIFQLATLFRYLRALIYGFKSRYYEVKKMKAHQKHFDSLWKCENHDVSLLRLIESFLESAPQLVLQFYIMLTKTVEIINVVSFVGSLIGLSTAMVSIQRAIRNTNPSKTQLTIPASIVMFLWRACTVSSRVLAFSLLLTIQPLVLLIVVVLHWIAAAVWIAWKGTNFCSKRAAEIFFDFVIGFVYTFCFFNVHEEEQGQPPRARYRMLAFYIISLVENSTLSIIWFFFRENAVVFFTSDDPEDNAVRRNENSTTTSLPSESDRIFPEPEALALVVMVHVLFFFGMAFLLLYYALCHPKNNSSKCPCSRRKRSASISDAGEDTGSVSQFDSEPNVMAQKPCSKTVPIESQAGGEEMGRRQVLQSSHYGNGTVHAPTTPSSHKNLTDIFSRVKRAEDLYTRQYSKEKRLESHETTSIHTKATDQHADAETISMKSFPKREASFRNKDRHSCPSDKTASMSKNASPSPVSKSSQPHTTAGQVGSQTNNNSNLPASRQYHHKRSASLPKKARRRGYSASMSCLVEGKYGFSSDSRFTNQAFCGPSYTLNADEVLECMETNL